MCVRATDNDSVTGDLVSICQLRGNNSGDTVRHSAIVDRHQHDGIVRTNRQGPCPDGVIDSQVLGGAAAVTGHGAELEGAVAGGLANGGEVNGDAGVGV